MFSGIPLFPEQASSLAPEVDALYFFILGVTAFFALLVVILVVYFGIKYRDDTGQKVGAPITGSVPLEIGWSIIPFLVAIAIFVWSAVVFFHYVRPPDETLELYATGKRWMWRFQHLDGQREINTLHVPVGRAIKVTFTSEDVLHDLYIPAFRVKADAIPGRYSAIWFTPTKTGEYHLFCAEYCGTRHSGMIGTVYVMEPNDYQAWLSGGGTGGTLQTRGDQLFEELACNTCHLSDGRGRGPSLQGLFGSLVTLADGQKVTADENYIRESILTPQRKLVAGFQPLMPTFQGLISEDALASLLELIKSMSAPGRTRVNAPPAAVAEQPNDQQASLPGGRTGSTPQARGARLFQQLACNTCHLSDGSGLGPSLQGIFGSQVTLANGQKVTADESYIRESILAPQLKLVAEYQPLMPAYEGRIDEEGLASLIEYMKSLSAQGTAPGR